MTILHIQPDGRLRCGQQTFTCALGKGGIRTDKREGDGATPVGDFRLGRVFYRADRLATAPETGLETIQTKPDMGWCDDPVHPDYNTLITLPHPAHHERLWRDDHVYDVVVEVHYNTQPVVPGRGSAIFIHVAKPGYTPTEGCVALEINDLLEILRICNEGSWLAVPDSDQAGAGCGRGRAPKIAVPTRT